MTLTDHHPELCPCSAPRAPAETAGAWNGVQTVEAGTLSIVQHGPRYQVRYASDNPYAHDRQSYTCADEAHLHAWLAQCGIESWALQRAAVELQRRGMTVLRSTLATGDVRQFFPLPSQPEAPQGVSQDTVLPGSAG